MLLFLSAAGGFLAFDCLRAYFEIVYNKQPISIVYSFSIVVLVIILCVFSGLLGLKLSSTWFEALYLGFSLPWVMKNFLGKEEKPINKSSQPNKIEDKKTTTNSFFQTQLLIISRYLKF